MLRQLCSLRSRSCAVSHFSQEKELRRDAVKPPFAVLQGATGSRGLTSILLGKPVWLICAGHQPGKEALAHHLLLLGMLQALGNPLSCSGTKHAGQIPALSWELQMGSPS